MMRRLLCILGLSCALLPQGRSPSTDSGRDTDLQAIYSWFLTHSTDGDKLHLVAPETQPTSYPERCIEIPPSHAADFREIRADFERRKNTTRLIPNPLLTSKRYVILDPGMAKEIIMTSPRLSQSPIVRERYPGTDYLLLFSDVYFNQKRTVALVEVNHWCGGLCGQSTWVAFEKGNDGVWQKQPWARCIKIASRNVSGQANLAWLLATAEI